MPEKFLIIPDFVSVSDDPAIENECSVSSSGLMFVRFLDIDYLLGDTFHIDVPFGLGDLLLDFYYCPFFNFEFALLVSSSFLFYLGVLAS